MSRRRAGSSQDEGMSRHTRHHKWIRTTTTFIDHKTRRYYHNMGHTKTAGNERRPARWAKQMAWLHWHLSTLFLQSTNRHSRKCVMPAIRRHDASTCEATSLLRILLGQDRSLLLLDLLVDFGTLGRLVAVHGGGQRGVLLSSLVLSTQVLAGLVVILRIGGGQSVANRTLVLWIGDQFCKRVEV